jgi:hypothetical protein
MAGRSRRRPRGGGARSGTAPAPRTRWWTRTVAWTVSILAGAVATVLTGWIAATPNLVKDLFIRPAAAPDVVTISVQHAVGPCSSLVTTRSITDVGPPPGDAASWDDWSGWSRNLGAYDHSDTNLLVTVRGGTAQPVVLTGLRVVVTERVESLGGIGLSNQCGDSMDGRILTINLDHRPPSTESDLIEPADDGSSVAGGTWRTTPLVFPYRVSDTMLETFVIRGVAQTCNCSWRAYLTWSDGKASGETTIDDHGQPFRTAAPKERTRYRFTDDRWTVHE